MMNLCPFTFMSLHVFYDFASNTEIVHQISFSSASTKTQKSSNLSALQWIGKNRQINTVLFRIQGDSICNSLFILCPYL